MSITTQTHDALELARRGIAAGLPEPISISAYKSEKSARIHVALKDFDRWATWLKATEVVRETSTGSVEHAVEPARTVRVFAIEFVDDPTTVDSPLVGSFTD